MSYRRTGRAVVLRGHLPQDLLPLPSALCALWPPEACIWAARWPGDKAELVWGLSQGQLDGACGQELARLKKR